MHLCTFVSEVGGDGEGTVSEATSLLSYTLRYVSPSLGLGQYVCGCSGLKTGVSVCVSREIMDYCVNRN